METKNILNEMLSLLFPETCVVCKTSLIRGEEQICLSCLNHLPYIRLLNENNPAGRLFAGQAIGSANSFLLYQKGNITQRLIYSLKYYRNKELGLILGRMAARSFMQLTEDSPPDILVPVPLHKRRMKQRGYNQSEWIARGFSSVWGIPVDTTNLVRIKKTKTQTRKTLYERLTNTETAFLLNESAFFEGKHILLIDDVITSGATLNACIRELSRCGDIKISIFSVSIAV